MEHETCNQAKRCQETRYWQCPVFDPYAPGLAVQRTYNEAHKAVTECNFCGEISTVRNPDKQPRINCPNCGISNAVDKDG